MTVTVQQKEVYPVSGTSFTVTADIQHVGTLSGTYTASIGKTDGPSTFTFPSPQTFSLGPGQQVTKSFAVSVPATGQDATDTNDLKVFVSFETNYTDTLEVCILPTNDVVTTPVSIALPVTTWLLTAQPTTTTFEGRWVKEVPVTGSDGCYASYGMVPGCGQAYTTNSGDQATLNGSNSFVDDLSMGSCLNHYVDKVDLFGAACQYSWPQPLRIQCQRMSTNPIFRNGSYVVGPMALDDGTVNDNVGLAGGTHGSHQQIDTWTVP